MSSFTNATASSGILRSEIPQQSLNEMKTSVFDMLTAFAKKRAKWATVIKRISEWSEEEINDEVQSMLQQFPDAENNFRYTLLKTIKTINARNGNKDTRIKMSALNSISLQTFYTDFVQRIIATPEMGSQSTFLSLRPSDKEIIARDAFRHTLYAHSHNLFDTIIVQQRVENIPTLVPTIQEEEPIEPTDSVSQAPSEVISIRASKDSRLSESILKLHNNEDPPPISLKGGSRAVKSRVSKVSGSSKKSYASKKSYTNIPPLKQRPVVDIKLFSAFSRVTEKKKNEDVIECEIKTESSTRRPRSHFTRSQRATTKKQEAPRFFDEDGIDVNTADVATYV